jgi:hypothetical protein
MAELDVLQAEIGALKRLQAELVQNQNYYNGNYCNDADERWATITRDLLQLRYACPISQSKHVRPWPEHELSEQRN